ncbi:hypothetical protein SAMN05192568_102033 [Methylobacterium pseudosasicola]|uniref:Uncharacterized protein n=1 Tax=Methylobacterium pseudosasicola TaxID=582667 RepID=A0A1I4NBQ9_9HYPH|nr:hypothetical protein SAMN05192568_102033 [Methylobacterium pseudosasicola]
MKHVIAGVFNSAPEKPFVLRESDNLALELIVEFRCRKKHNLMPRNYLNTVFDFVSF